MDNVTTRITTDKQVPGFWRVTLNHPPINTIDDQMYDEVFDLVEAIEAKPSLKVVTFESANQRALDVKIEADPFHEPPEGTRACGRLWRRSANAEVVVPQHG
jgi:enoyl-CoA hydratase/carnithine racemase